MQKKFALKQQSPNDELVVNEVFVYREQSNQVIKTGLASLFQTVKNCFEEIGFFH